MNWTFDIDGTWTAVSAITDEDGLASEWRVIVCEDGTFGVGESDSELTSSKKTFASLQESQAWCEKEEARLVERATQAAAQTDTGTMSDLCRVDVRYEHQGETGRCRVVINGEETGLTIPCTRSEFDAHQARWRQTFHAVLWRGVHFGREDVRRAVKDAMGIID